MRSIRLLWLGAAMALSVPAPAAADIWQNDRFHVGAWQGAAYDEGNRGQFSHCAISAPYKSGISLLFFLGRDFQWRMGMSDRRWNLQPGATYPVVYRIDRFPSRSGQVTARSKDFAIVTLPDDAQLFSQFREGFLLTIETARSTLRFSLKDTHAAFAALAACVNRHRDDAPTAMPFPEQPTRPSPPSQSIPPQSPPPQSLPPPSAPPQPTLQQRQAATALVQRLLNDDNMRGFRLLAAAEQNNPSLPEPVRRAHVAWASQGMWGMLTIIPRGVVANLNQARTAIIAIDSQACTGTFSSGVTADSNGAMVRRLYSSCRPAFGAEGFVYYLIVAQPDGSYYNFAQLGRGDQAAVRTAEAALREAVRRQTGR